MQKNGELKKALILFNILVLIDTNLTISQLVNKTITQQNTIKMRSQIRRKAE